MSTAAPRNIGVAGVGAMGRPMAQALLRAEFRVVAFDVRPRAEFGEFAAHMSEHSAALADRDALLCVVRSAAQIDQLCFETQALYRQRPYPPLLIVSSTVSPRFIADLRRRLPADVALIDAPMSGAPFSAEQASLSFMLGGDADAVGRCRPLFAAMGEKIFHAGGVGQGMACKVFNNYVAAAGVVAVRRSLARAAEWGLTPDTLCEVMRHSSGSTWFGNNLRRIDWATENYADDNTMAILIKDVSAALDAAGSTRDGFDEALLDAIRRVPDFPES